MRIFFGDTTNSGTTYYRMRAFMEPLIALGHDVAMADWHPERHFEAGWENKINDLATDTHLGTLMDGADVAVFQILHGDGPFDYVRALRKHWGKPVLMESDDNMFGIQADQAAFIDWHPGSPHEQRAMAQLEWSDGVVVSTEWLAELYGRVNKRVYVVRNGIDPKLWPDPEPAANGTVTIGWQGGASHDRDLGTIKDVVFSLADEFQNKVRWRFIGGVPMEFRQHPRISSNTDFVAVEDYPARMRREGLDIGLAPLCDSEFARAKSDLRFLEYAALGIPTVATKCEAYKTVQDGETGCVAETPEEWASILRELVANKDRRREMGGKARAWVMDNRTTTHSAREYERAIKKFMKAWKKDKGGG